MVSRNHQTSRTPATSNTLKPNIVRYTWIRGRRFRIHFQFIFSPSIYLFFICIWKCMGYRSLQNNEYTVRSAMVDDQTWHLSLMSEVPHLCIYGFICCWLLFFINESCSVARQKDMAHIDKAWLVQIATIILILINIMVELKFFDNSFMITIVYWYAWLEKETYPLSTSTCSSPYLLIIISIGMERLNIWC